MITMYIEELNRDLTGRLLAIWTGKNEDGSPVDMTDEKLTAYRKSIQKNSPVARPAPIGISIEAAADPEGDECVHRGEQIGDVACEPCGSGDRRIPVYGCAVESIGSCTRLVWRRAASRTDGPTRICRSCDARRPPDATDPPPPIAPVAESVPTADGLFCVMTLGEDGRFHCDLCSFSRPRNIADHICPERSRRRANPTMTISVEEAPAVVESQPVETPVPALVPASSVRERLILKCMLSPGDIMTLTAAIESLHAAYPGEYLTDVRTSTPEIWENNPHISPMPDALGRPVEMHYDKTKHGQIGQSNQRAIPFIGGYCEHLAETIGRPIPLATNRPRLYLSNAECGWTNQIAEHHSSREAREKTGQPAAVMPFWLVNAGVKSDFTAKQWPIENYQRVVDETSGRIQWVQIGSKHHDHPRLNGVIDLRGKTDTRQLIRLAHHCAGGLGPVTFLQHLCAAFEKPYFCLLGGREPVQWVAYPLQHTFHTMGALDCCRRSACWKSRVVAMADNAKQNDSLCVMPRVGGLTPVAACMQSIRPQSVVDAIQRYI